MKSLRLKSKTQIFISVFHLGDFRRFCQAAEWQREYVSYCSGGRSCRADSDSHLQQTAGGGHPCNNIIKFHKDP